LLTKLLLEKIKASQPTHIVDVSSSAHEFAPEAITTLYCATSPEIEEKNYREKYFELFGREVEPTSDAQDEDLAKRLWEYTENLINEKLPQK
ncbi:15734_t:CDS:2, partial [Racocetra persica]